MEREKLHRLLRLGLEKGASDIHFQVGCLPLYRFHGALVELRYKVLTPTDTEEITKELLGITSQEGLDFNERDLAFELAGEGASTYPMDEITQTREEGSPELPFREQR